MKRWIVTFFVLLMAMAISNTAFASMQKERPVKKAFVLAVFGTSYTKTLKSILILQQKMEKAFPEIPVHLAFTSLMKKLFSRSRGVTLLEKLVNNSESILDIGCGVGHIVHHFNNKRNSSIGVDIHSKSIFAAKQHFTEDSFLIADGTTLPFKPKSFDTIILSYSLHHIPSNIIRICKRLAKQQIIVIEMRNHPFFILINKIWDRFPSRKL